MCRSGSTWGQADLDVGKGQGVDSTAVFRNSFPTSFKLRIYLIPSVKYTSHIYCIWCILWKMCGSFFNRPLFKFDNSLHKLGWKGAGASRHTPCQLTACCLVQVLEESKALVRCNMKMELEQANERECEVLKKIWGSAQGMDSMLKYLQRKIDEFWLAGCLLMTLEL